MGSRGSRVRNTTGDYVFIGVCLLTGEVTPSPSHNTSTGYMCFPGGTPSPSHNTSNGPLSIRGGGNPGQVRVAPQPG